MTFRSPKLLRLARLAPRCMRATCQVPNTGQIVAAHSNQLRDGKGTGIKASDFRIAFLCDRCHADVDQGVRLTKNERAIVWDEAHRATIGWLFEAGHLLVHEPGDPTWLDPLTNPPSPSAPASRPKRLLPKRQKPWPTRKLESGNGRLQGRPFPKPSPKRP